MHESLRPALSASSPLPGIAAIPSHDENGSSTCSHRTRPDAGDSGEPEWPGGENLQGVSLNVRRSPPTLKEKFKGCEKWRQSKLTPVGGQGEDRSERLQESLNFVGERGEQAWE